MSAPFAEHGLRCVEQLALLSAWNGMFAQQGVPRIKQFPVGEFSPSVDRMMFCDVHADGGRVDLFVRFQGPQLLRMYGADFAGCYLDDTLPAAGRAQTLATLQSAVSRARPAFFRIRLLTGEGTNVQCDLLALPFRRKLLRVEMVVSLLTLFGEQPFDPSDFWRWKSAQP